LVSIHAIKHHGKAITHGAGATNKQALATQLLVEAIKTEWNMVAACMRQLVVADFLT
jgi:hypothetical protein